MKCISHLSDFIDHVVQHLKLVLTFLLVVLVDDLLSETQQHREHTGLHPHSYDRFFVMYTNYPIKSRLTNMVVCTQ